MNFAIIAGSHRKNSQSERIAHFLVKQVESLDPAYKADVIALSGNPLPLWDESFWDKDPKWNTTWQPISDKLMASDAVIICAPEWGGLVPAGVRNLFHFCGGRAELADKPGLIVGISSSRGGSYPVAELRSMSAKNTRIVYIPDHVVVRDCEKVLLDGPPASEDDQYMRARVLHSLKVLASYSQALAQVRGQKGLDLMAYPFGM